MFTFAGSRLYRSAVRTSIAILLVCGCDAGATAPSPTKSPTTSIRKLSSGMCMLDGPPPRSEFVSVDEPTAATINRELAGWYPRPALHMAVPTRDRDVTQWTRYYDGIEMDLSPVTSKSGSNSITRFKPELAAPELPQRDKLVGEASAIRVASLKGPANAKLVYMGYLVTCQLEGTRETTAADVVQVVESWRLVYRVDGSEADAYVGAYSGSLVWTWSHSIRD